MSVDSIFPDTLYHLKNMLSDRRRQSITRACPHAQLNFCPVAFCAKLSVKKKTQNNNKLFINHYFPLSHRGLHFMFLSLNSLSHALPLVQTQLVVWNYWELIWPGQLWHLECTHAHAHRHAHTHAHTRTHTYVQSHTHSLFSSMWLTLPSLCWWQQGLSVVTKVNFASPTKPVQV